MQVIKLKVKDSIYDKLLLLLNKFSNGEIEIIHDEDFEQNQKYLHQELEDIQAGNTRFIDIDEAERQIDEMIREYENHH